MRPRIITATNTRRERVFLLSQHSRTSMVGRAGQPKGWPVGDPVVSTLHVSPP
ncbi:ash family protein [Salmonella enterica subsp. enterica serovar Lome]|nr:ash family protein [Salmonella enterica subsp. enterica serovar Durham]EHF3438939.1 ash family protein [Salmonella enterica]ELD7744686.1 ash family protein [Salmonella enterica subsp. enterica serovar Lome]EEV4881293.1 ash family protein [Salmonella enterica subsp. enterica serovar Durham]EHG9471583.1 ash family protein [Salmonella enterica subsp. enterica serovar Durham]